MVLSHRRSALALSCCVLLALAAPLHAAAFSAGDIVVSRVGNGSDSLGSFTSSTFVDEFTPTGAWVQTISLPTSGNETTTFAATNIGGSAGAQEGQLELSGNGQFLTIAGYDVATGSDPSSAKRVVSLIDSSGNATTTTAISGISSSAIRAAYTTDGNTLFLATSGAGIRTTTLGTNGASTLLTGSFTSTRFVTVANNQLYLSAASGTVQGVATVGTGVQTTSGQTVTHLNGFPTSSGPSAEGFFFADASTLYVADDRSGSSSGLQKWTFNGSAWALAYTLNPGSVGFRAVTGSLVGSNEVMYAVGNDNQVYRITDPTSDIVGTGVATLTPFISQSLPSYATDPSVLGTTWVIRGIAFVPTAAVPEPASLGLLALGGLMLLRRRK